MWKRWNSLRRNIFQNVKPEILPGKIPQKENITSKIQADFWNHIRNPGAGFNYMHGTEHKIKPKNRVYIGAYKVSYIAPTYVRAGISPEI